MLTVYCFDYNPTIFNNSAFFRSGALIAGDWGFSTLFVVMNIFLLLLSENRGTTG
jgi:hypothetical protein